MQLIKNLTLILLAATAAEASAAPPPIVTQGSGAAIACASCHGMEGAGNSAGGYPALAHLPVAYITKQIADFKSGARTNAVMTPIAKALSMEDAETAARFYTDLPRKPSASAPTDAAVLARGENLAINGAWDRGLPACFKCHGAGGYTISQLQAWKTGSRGNDPLQLMKTVVEKLSDEDMRAVAAYIATLGTQEKPK